MTWNRNIPGLLTDDVRLRVPLNRSNPDDLRTIEVYARVVATPTEPTSPTWSSYKAVRGVSLPARLCVTPGFPVGCRARWRTISLFCSISAARDCRLQ